MFKKCYNIFLIKVSSLILITLLISASVFSQQVIEKKITWNSSKIIKENSNYQQNVKEFFDFTHISYPEIPTELPYYSELISINSDDYDIDFTPVTFEKADKNILKNYTDIDKVPTMITAKKTLIFIKKQPFIELSFLPFRKNSATGEIEKLTSFSYKKKLNPQKKAVSSLKKSYASNSMLSSGKWFKIKITRDGVYKLTYAELMEIGLESPENVRVYGYGGGMIASNNNEYSYDDLPENDVYINAGTDGIFNEGDYILFYAKGPLRWKYSAGKFIHETHVYSDASYYFLTSSFGAGSRVSDFYSISTTETHVVNEFTDYAYHDEDEENLINSGREFYEPIDFQPEYTFSFSFPNCIKTLNHSIKTRVLARSGQKSDFRVAVNGTQVQNISTSALNLSGFVYASEANVTSAFTTEADQVAVTLSFINSDPAANGWLDYIILNVKRQLSIYGDQMGFRNIDCIGPGNVTTFNISNYSSEYLIWDVSDPIHPMNVNGIVNGSVFAFRTATDSLKEFIAFNTSSGFLTPTYKNDADVGRIGNQNLHNMGYPDLIIVSHDDFFPQAQKLAQLHRTHDNMEVVTVSPHLIYHEFSSGMPDASAIRNFVKMFYDRAGNNAELMPRYLLLYGDGSFDNKLKSSENTNFIPTYQSANSISQTGSYCTDDFFGLLDDNEGAGTITSSYLDIGIGRLPVRTSTEATNVLNKIIRYVSTSSMGDWRNVLCFIGDDQDGNLHYDQANKLADTILRRHPSFNVSKIFLDAYKQEATPSGQRYPEAKNEITNRIKNGALIVNYTGHGGEVGLAHERIIEINDIVSWDNIDKLMLFVTASCEFSRYDDYHRTSAGEYVLLNPTGAGVALLSTTRLVYANQNFELNKNFYDCVFEKDNQNNKLRLGDVIQQTKIKTGSSINKRNFALLGDPAIELAYPLYNVVTDSINNNDANITPDTLRAFNKIIVKGHIEDENGMATSSFNGYVYPRVYDKQTTISTLANDADSYVSNFKVQNNIIYRGKATVKDGKFSFSFIIPKDINYSFGNGKISYYALNSENDYHGNNQNIIIGGTADSGLLDNTGPVVKLYLNDKNFVTGGITDNKPTLIAEIMDSSGINTVGNGIGHDISVYIDENVNDKISLNEFYESSLDNYQEGKVEYSFSGLKAGEHKLTFKIWDVNNNSTEETLDFVVTETENLKIDHVLNYPNPFTTNTEFMFEHNHPGVEMNILIQIYTVSGKLVKTLRQDLVPPGYRIRDIRWDGKDDFGDNIGRGVYFYKLSVRTSDGKKTEKIEKLVILK